ncbi:unnamed protein product [Adineta steineri]|uniref:NAD(P)(+)--arginine ADP-ribosyltransferase n=1 Tax=Adineta steineri TaxID=433720 RepID=A0A819WLV9_9BILA|nr:unnamed protein product [Adineta steineri]CAF4128641.1 unnamed protein product [Adineta steineri]
MAAKDVYTDGTENKHDRFLDVGQEPRRMLQPIEGYQKMPLVTLEKAVEPIAFCCPDIYRRVFIAMSNCEKPADGLDQNESASIFLYTMEWEPQEECLYHVLNKTLRTENRQKLRPWFSYLKLVLTALQKLPAEKQTIWRGVTLDLSQQYEVGKRYVWWAFSSCTRSLAILESEQFLGKRGSRTLFSIECQNGKKIRSHSYIDVEDEILLLPATQFEVISKLNPSSDLHIIHLKQVDPPFCLIELPPIAITLQVTSQTKKNEVQLSNNYRNEKLEKLIAQCPFNKTVNLDSQGLTDNDIPIIIQHAIIDKKCWYLNINKNMITDNGINHLAEAIESNTSLGVLTLIENQITDVGVHHIAQALHTNRRLVFLNLGFNQITEKGARFLSESLQANSTLEDLLIDYTSIGDRGIQYLANTLVQNSTLETLSLAATGLTDNGVTNLAKMLKHNTTLIALDVDHNPITDSGIKLILDALCNNNVLQKLHIQCEQMTNKSIKDTENMLKLNDTLTDLHVLQETFTIEEQQKLQEMLSAKQNRRLRFDKSYN